MRAARVWFHPVLAGLIAIAVASALPPAAQAQEDISRRIGALNEDVSLTGADRLSLREALTLLHVPSVSLAVIEGGKLAWAGALGSDSSASSYQAASLSKFVTAVGVMRLVEQGKLNLDADVNTQLTSWKVPDSPLTKGHPVTLRGLLSMTAGINVPGYMGYAPGSRIPNLKQILDGAQPANSPAVKVEKVPGSSYAYSGGGYEIIQQLVEDVTRLPFATAMEALVLKPAGMEDSFFRQPPPKERSYSLALGHDAHGAAMLGGWRVMPELAAGGLWSTPTDLARLLVLVSAAWRGETNPLLRQETARAMFAPQNKGPYGLGAAVRGEGAELVVMKRGQNPGFQCYMLVFPETGQGLVVMTGADNGTALAEALVRRTATVFGWPALGRLED
ncbi:serine hydrolase domain-containing protein [Xanthobacteraceae bacterium A53D]